jgi:single-strand DNA-binding protein
MDLNKILLIGRLGKNPVQSETKNGLTVVHFTMATSRRLRDPEGGPALVPNSSSGEDGVPRITEGRPKEETTWHRITAWGKTADACAQYMKKGDTVYVEGSVRSSHYTAKDGTPRMSFEVNADRVSFLSSPRSRETALEALSQAAAS